LENDVDLCPHSRYYRTIRHCPRGARWSSDWPTHLHVRRQRHVFQWDLRVRTLDFKEDEWLLSMTPQFADDAMRSVVLRFLHHLSDGDMWRYLLLNGLDFADLTTLDWWISEDRCRLFFAVDVERTCMRGPPTRQWCAQRMVDFTRQLDDAMQRQWAAWKKTEAQTSR